jgi:hypothetical protein
MVEARFLSQVEVIGLQVLSYGILGRKRRGKGRSKWAQHVQNKIFHAIGVISLEASKGVF